MHLFFALLSIVLTVICFAGGVFLATFTKNLSLSMRLVGYTFWLIPLCIVFACFKEKERVERIKYLATQPSIPAPDIPDEKVKAPLVGDDPLAS